MPTNPFDLEQRLMALEKRLVSFERQLAAQRLATPSEISVETFPLPDVVITGATWQPSTEMKSSDVEPCLRSLWSIDDANGIVVLS